MEEKDVVCEHCGWKGKHILKHMRHSKCCMNKTDMDQLKLDVEQKKTEQEEEI